MYPFSEKLLRAAETTRSLVSVGLDPDPASMPVPDVLDFNRAIVDATKDLVCAYKPNLAFYEGLGLKGLKALKDTIEYIRTAAPSVVVIGDAKRGDVASTNVFYARALFEYWDFDAATVNGWAGGEALDPFLAHEDRGVLVWCRSSNPGAAELQDLSARANGDSVEVYRWMARRAKAWNTRGNVGLVVGATYPGEIAQVRSECPNMPLLVPGIGAQGGDLASSVKAGMDAQGRGMIIASSRSVLYASADPHNFAEAARQATAKLRDAVNLALDEDGKGW